MGAKRSHIFNLIISEAGILSLTGGVIGILIGGMTLYLFKGYIRSALNIPYLWPSTMEFSILILLCLLLSLITGVGAALFPAIRATRMEPYLAIRGGE
jgi:putative ABC transport system permease protein